VIKIFEAFAELQVPVNAIALVVVVFIDPEVKAELK
jgi:hypothetical protein